MYLCMSCEIKFCVVTRHTNMLEIPLVLRGPLIQYGPFPRVYYTFRGIRRIILPNAILGGQTRVHRRPHRLRLVSCSLVSPFFPFEKGLLASQLLVFPWSRLSRVQLHSSQQYPSTRTLKRPFRNKMRLVAWTLSLLPLASALPQITRQGKYLFDPSGNRFFIKVGMHRSRRKCMRTHD